MSALRAPSTASPPLNMHRSLIFNGASVCTGAVFIFLFRGHQRRREKDARIAADASAAANAIESRNSDGPEGIGESMSQGRAGRGNGRRWVIFGKRRWSMRLHREDVRFFKLFELYFDSSGARCVVFRTVQYRYALLLYIRIMLCSVLMFRPVWFS